MNRKTARRIIEAAYEQGWSDACQDHLTQRDNPQHPIGDRKHRNVDSLLYDLDPRNVTGLRAGGVA